MELRQQLESRLQEPAPSELDLLIELRVAGECPVWVALADGYARLSQQEGKADATFCFDSAATAAAILYGDGDFLTAFMDAFMDGKVRSDGNLPLTFALLGLFRPGLGMEAPD